MRRHANTPSLGRIAEEAGVSRAAVSMALRNHPRIPASTRARIQAIANNLGWKPNPLLAEAMSAIRAGQPPVDRVTLAWITADRKREAWKDSPFQTRCVEGATRRADNAGYRLDHFWLGDTDGNANRLSEILYARGIAGVIIGPFRDPGRIDLQWDRFAAATISHTLIEPRLHRANDNHTAGARVCVARLRATGRSRIGLALSARLDHRIGELWTAGYLLETLEEGVNDPKLIHRPQELEEKAFLAWVKKAKPDSIVSTERHILEWLANAGYDVPGDIAFASLDLPTNDGSIAGIYQDAAGIGGAAIDMVAGQLLRHERGLPDKPKTTIIDGRWIDGTTVPTPPRSATPVDYLLANQGDLSPYRPVVFD